MVVKDVWSGVNKKPLSLHFHARQFQNNNLLRVIDSFRIFYRGRQFCDKFNLFSPGFLYCTESDLKRNIFTKLVLS